MVLPLLLLCSAGIAADPCVGSCGRELNCGSLNKSFTCDELSRMRCNCVGCCRFTLGSPLLPPPPAQPPPTPRLPSPPPAQPPPTPPGLGSGLGLGLGLGSGLGLVLGLGLGLAAKTAKKLVKKYLVQKRKHELWAGCTTDPPITKWHGNKSYACFLSHVHISRNLNT